MIVPFATGIAMSMSWSFETVAGLAPDLAFGIVEQFLLMAILGAMDLSIQRWYERGALIS